MKEENLINVKLEYGEALQSKKDILTSEMNLLRIAKALKNYHILRTKELKSKSKLHFSATSCVLLTHHSIKFSSKL